MAIMRSWRLLGGTLLAAAASGCGRRRRRDDGRRNIATEGGAGHGGALEHRAGRANGRGHRHAAGLGAGDTGLETQRPGRQGPPRHRRPRPARRAPGRARPGRRPAGSATGRVEIPGRARQAGDHQAAGRRLRQAIRLQRGTLERAGGRRGHRQGPVGRPEAGRPREEPAIPCVASVR